MYEAAIWTQFHGRPSDLDRDTILVDSELLVHSTR